MKEKITVGLFIDTYFPMMDGVISVVDNYAKRLSDDGFEVIVFAPKTRQKNYEDKFSYRLERCKSVKIFFMDYDLPLPKMDRHFKEVLSKQKLDIVHIHSPFSLAKMALKYAKKHKIPSVITFHSQFKLDIKRSVKSELITNLYLKHIMKIFNRCDECFTMNEFSKKLLKEYGCKRPITLIRNATDMHLLKSVDEYAEIANQNFNLQHEKFVMLYVGRINFLKNLELIVDALAKLPKEMEYKMIFAGDGLDRQALEKKVKKLGLSEKVLFTGKIMDRELLKTLYARSDVFLIPSVYDTDAIVKTEASCFSKPSICLKDTGAGSIIVDGHNGFLVEEDADKLAELIAKLACSPELLKSVGRCAHEEIYITWDKVILDLKNNYKRIIKEYAK